MLNLIEKIAIGDADDLSIVEIITNVSDTFEGATSFSYSNETERITVGNAQTLPYKTVHTVELIGLPTSSVTVSNLEHFNDPETDVVFTMVGSDGAVICQDSVKCEWLEKPEEGRSWRFMITFETLPYREPDNGRKSGGLHISENLMQVYSFEDTDGDGVANGWSTTGTVANTSFTSGVQTYDVAGDQDSTIEFEPIFFPFEDEELTLSADFGAFVVGDHTTTEFKLVATDNNDSEVGSSEVTPGGTGRHDTTLAIPANTVYVQPMIELVGGASTGQTHIDFTDVALRVDGEDTFVPY